MFMPWQYTTLLVTHILAVMVAVGTVTVTDYLHLLGFRDRVLEKRTLPIFPLLSNLIRGALALIYITGLAMVWMNPSVLSSPLFWLKVTLVLIVTINGFFLHHWMFPRIEKETLAGKPTTRMSIIAAAAGSLSVVSWYGIVVLALTKEIQYSVSQFLVAYLLMLFGAFIVAAFIETRDDKDRE